MKTARMKNPPHPGLGVRVDCLEPYNLSITKGAEILGVTRQTLSMLGEHSHFFVNLFNDSKTSSKFFVFNSFLVVLFIFFDNFIVRTVIFRTSDLEHVISILDIPPSS